IFVRITRRANAMKLRAYDFLAIAILLVGIALPAALGSQEKSITLTGGVEHSDLLPPVPDDLKSGATVKASTFDQITAVPADGRTSQSNAEPYVDYEWYRVPRWLTGTWQRQDVTQYYHLDYKSGKEDSNAT